MKKEKIIITGGLGYIGTELCKLYSGETRFKDITVIDNRFVSERVKQLRDWGFNFIQADILDKKKMEEVLWGTDVIHHLAGITDVAYVKTEANSEKDELITKTAVEGTQNILNYSPDCCKIIFPSTHVVFEGFERVELDIDESVKPVPVLTYAKGKVQNEIDIKKTQHQYVILRLGSVYGYSTDTMRIGIMPNLFSKMASQDSTIKLFGGGVQYKSLVSLIDVARCFKFMAEDNSITNETFHLVNEQTTVKDVAELCKTFKPELNIISTDDEVPNLGYTLSNKRLLATGFKFLYNLEDSVKEMITNWSKKDINPDLEYIMKGGKEFVDSRGEIRNYELPEPINLIGYIESKKGTVRANHYHPIQEQKCLLISGKYISVIKDLADPNAVVKTQIISPGDIAVIKPNVAHTMVFLENSIFLNLVRGEREHENYGITHTIPYTLVNEDLKEKILKNSSVKCRCCTDILENTSLVPILSLGLSPLANNLLDDLDDKDDLYPLELMYCTKCHNVQLSHIVPPKIMFDNYLYVSSTTKSFKEHFQKAADKYIMDLNLSSKSLVVDIGSNDGIALKPLQEKGIKVLGVEPAKNIAEIAKNNGIETINEYFDFYTSYKIIKSHGLADVVTASNVFAHSDELRNISNGAFNVLKQDGYFIIEVQYLLNTIKDLTFDNIYHEHVNYWSVTALNYFFKTFSHEYFIAKVEHIDTHGGSIRVYVSKNRNSPLEDGSLEKYLLQEFQFGIKNIDTYKEFSKNVEQVRERARNNIKKYPKLIGYGAPAKATTTLNYYGFTSKDIKYIIEDNPLKHNKYIPGVKIPIYSKDVLEFEEPCTIVVMAWNFFEEIKKNNQHLIDKGFEFISIKDL